MTHGLVRTQVQTIEGGAFPAAINVSHFQGADGVDEYHLMVRPTAYAGVSTQWAWVSSAYRSALATLGLEPGTAVLRRIFCSDLPNQAATLDAHPIFPPDDPGAVCAESRVGQPPAPPAKVALWAYHVRVPGGVPEKHREGAALSLKRGSLTHIWTTGLTCPDAETSHAQTEAILAQYEADLQARGLRVADHVQRTWFFVQDVDANYKGLVAARKAFFASRGLTADTHYIASTGIEGRSAEIAATVMMDAYAIAGVRPDQIQYLADPDHLCPTHLYGVTFERGVSVVYRDRKQILISGTASIDQTGRIVHPGDVLRQLDRTLENVDALLRQAGATFEDVGMCIVYVRDASDMEVARQMLDERCGNVPMQIVVAPVCRPGWLIEVECMATIAATNPELPPF